MRNSNTLALENLHNFLLELTKLFKKISDVNYETNKSNAHMKEKTEIVFVSNIKRYYSHKQDKLSHEK